MAFKIGSLLFLLIFGSFVLARIYAVGPLVWLKRAALRSRALEGTDRRELLDRVRQLLPQANDCNVIFSLHRENSSSGGSKVTVISTTYYYNVFVVDGDFLWVLPMAYDKRRRSYQLGTPVRFSASDVRQVRLTGKHGKTLTFHFLLELDGRKLELAMALTPYCFRLNKYYPFTLMQEEACEKARQTAERMAFIACSLSASALEKERLKDECGDYALYAVCASVFGLMCTPTESPIPVLACFAISLILFGVMLSKKQVPKVSAVLVLLAAVGAYLMMRP